MAPGVVAGQREVDVLGLPGGAAHDPQVLVASFNPDGYDPISCISVLTPPHLVVSYGSAWKGFASWSPDAQSVIYTEASGTHNHLVVVASAGTRGTDVLTDDAKKCEKVRGVP